MAEPRQESAPSFAQHMLRDYRETLELPERVTDNMLYARIMDKRAGKYAESELEACRLLIAETETPKKKGK